MVRVAPRLLPVLLSPIAGYDLYRGEAVRSPDLGCRGAPLARYRSPGRRRLHGVNGFGNALSSRRVLSS